MEAPGLWKRSKLSGCEWLVRLPRLLHSVDEPHQLLLGMGQGHIVMLAFSTFLGEVGGKGRVPAADVLRGVVDGIAQVSGSTLLHMGIAVVELPRLVGRRRKAGVSQNLVGRIETGEITHLSQNHGSHAEAYSRNGGNGRVQLLHNGLDRGFNIRYLGVQFPDEANGVPQFQRLGGHKRTNRGSGCLPDGYGHIPSIVTFGGVGQEELQPR